MWIFWFRRFPKGRSSLSGGHKLKKFNAVMKDAEDALELLTDIDITENTAPTIDIECDLFRNVGLVEKLMRSRHPWLTKLIMWKAQKKIDRMHKKYLGSDRTGENFKKYKTYRLFLYKKKS